MRIIGYCRDCRKIKPIVITSQNLIVNRLEGICDDCASTTPRHRQTPAPRPRRH